MDFQSPRISDVNLSMLQQGLRPDVVSYFGPRFAMLYRGYLRETQEGGRLQIDITERQPSGEKLCGVELHIGAWLWAS